MPEVFYRPFRTRGVHADASAFRRIAAEGFRTEIAPDLIKLHEQQVDYWRQSPDFSPQFRITPDFIQVNIQVGGRPARIWNFLNEGVEGRVIRPRMVRTTGRGGRSTGRALRFPDAGGDIIFRTKANWPGISARRYPQRVAQDYEGEFRRKMENILRRAVRAMQR